MGSDNGNGIIALLGFAGCVIVGVICGAAGLGSGAAAGRHEIRMEAVSRGHAEFVPQSDGTTKFRWKGSDTEASDTRVTKE